MTDKSDSSEAGETSVDRVSVRLPPFWPDDPDIWFAQVEAQFETSRVKTDATKFYTVIQQLDWKVAREVRDVITNPPKTGRYEKLKNELLKRLSSSKEQRMRQLLTHEELGDRKPSQFLRHLRSLADTGVTDDFLRSLWSSRLPNHVQAIIATQTSPQLDEIADLADKICEVTPTSAPQVASVSTNKLEELIKNMEHNIATRIQNEVTQQIAQLNFRGQRGRSPYRRYFNNRSREASRNSRSRSRQSQTPGMCWYHDNFAGKAKKCVPPCNFKAGNPKDGQ